MTNTKKVKCHHLGTWIEDDEYRKMMETYEASGCRSVSEYLRKVFLNRPITMYYRNKSLDEFIEESIRLRKALALFSSQAGVSEEDRTSLLQKIEGMRLLIVKIHEICSQK